STSGVVIKSVRQQNLFAVQDRCGRWEPKGFLPFQFLIAPLLDHHTNSYMVIEGVRNFWKELSGWRDRRAGCRRRNRIERNPSIAFVVFDKQMIGRFRLRRR